MVQYGNAIQSALGLVSTQNLWDLAILGTNHPKIVMVKIRDSQNAPLYARPHFCAILRSFCSTLLVCARAC